MYEVKSCGVTLEITPHHATADSCFNQSNGAVVILLKYNGAGQKVVVNRKYNHLRSVSSSKTRSTI